ncbi:hypothetical protein [Desulfosarcina variabilis]
MGRDLVLIAVCMAGILGGVCVPDMAAVFSPYVLQCMMVILFF